MIAPNTGLRLETTDEAPLTGPVGTFTRAQLAQRRQTLGASEIPVVAGLYKYKSPIMLWQEKRGLVQSFEGNEATEWGNRLEAVVADKYAEVRGIAIRTSETLISAEHPWMSATPDRITLEDQPRGLEVKCRGEFRGEEWGEPGTDEVPHDVAIQCHWGMMVTKLSRWDVATLIGGNKFRKYELYADTTIAADLFELGRQFWFDYVLTGVQPPIDGSDATTAFLKSAFMGNGGGQLRPATVEEAAWLESLKEVRDEKKHIEGREAELKNLLMNAIGDSAGLSCPIGYATWNRPAGSIVPWKEVAEAAGATPEIIARFAKPQSRRFVPTFPKSPKR